MEQRKIAMEELGRKSVSEFKQSKKTPLVLVLDNVRSALNVGSVFRTADAFLLQEIHLCGITAQPPDKEIQKTALGATETVAWKYYTNTMDSVTDLKGKGYDVYAIEQVTNSIKLNEFKPGSNPIAVVFGHEVKGVEEDVIKVCDGCIEIPQIGSKHSLNVSVCAGIVTWDLFNKLK